MAEKMLLFGVLPDASGSCRFFSIEHEGETGRIGYGELVEKRVPAPHVSARGTAKMLVKFVSMEPIVIEEVHPETTTTWPQGTIDNEVKSIEIIEQACSQLYRAQHEHQAGA